MKRLAFTLSVAAVVVALGVAGLDAITLKRSPKVGDKIVYSMEGNISIQGQDGAIAGKGSEVIKAVDATGTYTAETAQLQMSFNGQEFPPQDPTTQVEKADGEIVSISGPAAGNGSRLNNLLQLYFPLNPVNPGDTWSRELKPAPEGSVPIHVDGKFIDLEKLGDWDTAKIEETVKETDKDGGSVHSTFWVNPTDGSMYKEVSELTNVSFGPAIASTGKLTVTRDKS